MAIKPAGRSFAASDDSPSGSDAKPAHPLRQWDIFLFWVPLFTSWLMMTLEGPLLSAAVNRLPDEVVMLAAFGIVITLAITIESPIINLLATATARVKDRPSFELVRRFTVHWIIGLTIISILLAFTPLFDLVVRRLLGVPKDVAVWVRPGLQILTLWTAAIAWRRFLQGVLIAFNRTRLIARGTIIRLFATVGTAFAILRLTDWPGVHLASTALMVGVLTEAVYATIVVQPTLREHLAPGSASREDEPLTYRQLFWFHLPLAGTAILALAAQPMVTFALARLPEPTLALAAWPLIFHATLLMRTATFSLPEAVIALTKGPETYAPIRRFSLTLAGLVLVAVALFTWTPLVDFYLTTLQDAEQDVATLAAQGLALFLVFPALATVVAWITGLLIQSGHTKLVNEAMMINVLTIAAVLTPAVLLGWPGIPSAALAMTSSVIVQLFYLQWRRRQLIESNG